MEYYLTKQISDFIDISSIFLPNHNTMNKRTPIIQPPLNLPIKKQQTKSKNPGHDPTLGPISIIPIPITPHKILHPILELLLRQTNQPLQTLLGQDVPNLFHMVIRIELVPQRASQMVDRFERLLLVLFEPLGEQALLDLGWEFVE